MSWRDDLRADLARSGGPRSVLRERSTWAIVVHRWGTGVFGDGPVPLRFLQTRLYWAAYRLVEALTGISLPAQAVVGPGLRIHHAGPVVVHPDTVIGSGCTLRHGVTLGERRHGAGVPVLGDGVDVGAYAQILGPVTIGDGCRIGALALVQDSFAPGSVVVAPRAVARAERVSPRTE